MQAIEEEIGRRVLLISLAQVEVGNCIWIVDEGERVFDGVSPTTIVLVGFDTVAGLKVIEQLEKKPAVKGTPWVPAGSDVSSPIAPVNPVAVMAGLGLRTLLTTTTTLATKTLLPVSEAKAPLKVTVVADVEHVKELMLTESTVID